MIDWYDKQTVPHDQPERRRPHQRPHFQDRLRRHQNDAGRSRRRPATSSSSKLQRDQHEWLARTARRVLQERGRPDVTSTRSRRCPCWSAWQSRHRPSPAALWALHAIGEARRSAGATAPFRSRSVCRRLGGAIALRGRKDILADTARSAGRAGGKTTSPVVRLYLASAALRMPGRTGGPSSPHCWLIPRMPPTTTCR